MTIRFIQRGALAAALLLPALAQAEVKLPAILSSHMVLQRNQPIHLWGWAAAQEPVSADLNAVKQSTVADTKGRWDLYLPARQAGGPYALTINNLRLEDVMIGDVWFASGQSNMEMPLSGFPNSATVVNQEQEIRNATHPNLRLLLVPKKTSDFPQPDFEPTAWTPCTPETAAKFSAVAYFFGRELAEKEQVTIGLIDSTWGGTPAEAWVSMHGLAADPGLIPLFESWATFADQQTNMQITLEAEKKEDEAARQANRPLPQHPWHPNANSWQPAALYNAMVAPAVGFHIKGAIWYQGESNASLDRANLYEKLLPALIADWRSDWHQGNFPFFFVQIANFKTSPEGTWPVVREAQRRTLAVANTGMAVTIDIGELTNIHPGNKQDVGLRLALAARKVAYGEDIEFSGPAIRTATTQDHALRIWFDHTTGGLSAKGGNALQGFEIAGSDKHYVPASATIDGESVLVSADSVPTPQYVRYGWANAPTVNLVNGNGLPASPFTTEEKIPRP